jgi:hypothetical protein
VDFPILGPLEARAHGRTLAVGGPRQRALLAVLLMSANRVVARERLLEELGSDEISETVSHTRPAVGQRLPRPNRGRGRLAHGTSASPANSRADRSSPA